MDRQGEFDSIARYYDSLAGFVFGSAIQKSQTEFLKQLPAVANVLVIGGGTGRWLSEFIQRRPAVEVTYIDASAKMLTLAKRGIAGEGRVHFKLGTQDALTPLDQFDVVITFFFLDLFSESELAEVIRKIRVSLKPGGIWLATDFVDKVWWHSAMLFFMYSFFRITTHLRNQRLPNWKGLLLKNQLMNADERKFYGDFIESVFYKSEG